MSPDDVDPFENGGPLRRLLRRIRPRRAAPAEERRSSGMIGRAHLVLLDAEPPPPLRGELAVFSRPRVPQDELREAIVAKVRDFDVSDWSETSEIQPAGVLDADMEAELEAIERRTTAERGHQLPDESRVLLRDLGVERLQLFAVPTTTGQVWIYLVDDQVGMRGGWPVAALPDAIEWQISYEREWGEPTRFVAFRLVTDDVKAVDIEFNGKTEPAVVANNGFFYEAVGREPTDVAAFVLHSGEGERRITTNA